MPRKGQPYDKSEDNLNLKSLTVTYDVLLSPSYRVPVLYFNVRDSSGSPITDQAAILTDVVLVNFRSQVADVGLIGGISMTVTTECTNNILYQLH